jgi:Spy/CpxP family protein refolding chaperone
MKRTLLYAAVAAIAVGTAVLAQPGPGYGPGSGMGPGMMGGYGMGPGMMGGGGMGPGMMGGGMGPGMMGGALYGLELTDEQRTKITEIRRELFGKHWEQMGKIHLQGSPMDEAYASGKFDEKAARKAFEAMNEAHKQMFEASLQAQKRIDALLTPAQRDQLRSTIRGKAPAK